MAQTIDWGTLPDNQVYNFNNGTYLKQGKAFTPVFGDATAKYGKAADMPYDAQTVLVNGGTIVPQDYGINLLNLKSVTVNHDGGSGGINYFQDAQGNLFNDPLGKEAKGNIRDWKTATQSGQTYDQALNDSSTPRSIPTLDASGAPIQGASTTVSGTQALADQASARTAYNAVTAQNALPREQQPFYKANTPTTAPTVTIAGAKTETLGAVPFISSMTEKQKSGVTNLVNSGRAFSETDAKNYAFATGQADWSQFVGKTGAQILATPAVKAPVLPPAGGTAYLVKGGDTLSAIATKFGTTVSALMAANPDIKNPNLIYPNQKIIVPEVNAKTDPNKGINDIQKDIAGSLDKTTGTKEPSLFKDVNKDVNEPATPVEFKIPSLLEKYNALVNTPDITNEKTRLADITSKLNDLDLQESQLESDIRKEVEGEAPTSLIRALVAEKAKAIYPQKQALLNEQSALQTKLTNDLLNAKDQFQYAVADQANGLKYIESLADSGVKLTAEQYAIADKALGYGTGFTKNLVEAKIKANNLATEKDNLDLMTKIVTLQSNLPEGKSFSVGGVTYTAIANPDKDIQIFKETDAKTNTEVIIEYNKKTRAVKVTNTGVKAKSTSTDTAPKDDYFTKPKADGSIGYYFGNEKSPAGAQELSKKSFLDGVSKAVGVLDPENKIDYTAKLRTIDKQLADGVEVDQILSDLTEIAAEENWPKQMLDNATTYLNSVSAKHDAATSIWWSPTQDVKDIWKAL